jgi:hypothetical protein
MLDLAALTPGTVATSKTGRRYRLTEFIAGRSGSWAPMWWAEPVDGGRRRRLMAADFTTYGWTVERQRDPEVITWALTRSTLSIRHMVMPGDPRPFPATLCGATARYMRPSTPIDPASMWDRATVCRHCDRKATARGMVTREQLDARQQKTT